MTIMTAQRDVRRRPVHACALLATAIFCAGIVGASAEVRVVDRGSGNVVVEARDATVRQILEALSESRMIQFRGAEALSRTVTGTYSGTLPHVLSRILDRDDHVIQSTPSGIRLSVFGAARSTKTTAIASAVTVAPTVSPSGQKVSTNVDLDEETAQAGTAPARTTKPVAPPAYRPAAASIAPVPAVLTGSAQGSTAARISTNVDLDEETR
jgi:hypothetical protein